MDAHKGVIVLLLANIRQTLARPMPMALAISGDAAFER
jgi:hypothetical protein